MVIETKKSKSVFIFLGISTFICVLVSALIILFVEDKDAIPFILIAPAMYFTSNLIVFIMFLIKYIKKPYDYIINFEDEYIVFSNEREVYYKELSYVLTDDNDYVKYFVITSHDKIGFNHKSPDVNEFLIDLLKSKGVKVIDSKYKNNTNKCVAKIYWLTLEEGGKRYIPFTNMYVPQIILGDEKMNDEIAWSAFVINKEEKIDDRTTIADIMLFSEKCPYELKVGQIIKLYEGNRLVAKGQVIKETRV